jgi:hypothetical protein
MYMWYCMAYISAVFLPVAAGFSLNQGRTILACCVGSIRKLASSTCVCRLAPCQ